MLTLVAFVTALNVHVTLMVTSLVGEGVAVVLPGNGVVVIKLVVVVVDCVVPMDVDAEEVAGDCVVSIVVTGGFIVDP
jgi:hypothetical protein